MQTTEGRGRHMTSTKGNVVTGLQRGVGVAIALVAALASTDVRAQKPGGSPQPPGFVPGAWVTYSAPSFYAKVPDRKQTLFVADRPPAKDEKIPAVPKSALPAYRCGAPWQFASAPMISPPGAWVPNPNGDGRWAWMPSSSILGTPTPPPLPSATPNLGDEIYFCAKAPGGAPWVKPPKHVIPGTWIRLEDPSGGGLTTYFDPKPNATVVDGDAVVEPPMQVSVTYKCAQALWPRVSGAWPDSRVRSPKPYGEWVPEPFGNPTWVWVGRANWPYNLRPPPMPTTKPLKGPRQYCKR
jgi:hypothetical protein